MRKQFSAATLALSCSCAFLACGGRYEPDTGDGGWPDGGRDRAASDAAHRLEDVFGIPKHSPAGLVGRAILPAATFVDGPASGQYAGVNFSSQPVQGFSCLVDAEDGSFWALSDNGYGSIENSADFRLRIYRVRPDLKTKAGGSGGVSVESYVELHDPDHRVKFAIVNEFTTDRVLTGADFDVESLRIAPDGTLWLGDELGPFVLHFDAAGKLLDAPIALPDPDHPDQEVRAPQNPFLEEGSSVRIMNAFRQRGLAYGNPQPPVFSPWHVHLVDRDSGGNRGFNTQRDNLAAPNTPGQNGDTGLTAANDEFVRLTKSPGAFPNLQAAGHSVVTWTVNDPARMTELLELGVNGIISDRPDLLFLAVADFDANRDGVRGDYLDADGLIDARKFDAQAHRGGRNLRPENSLPSMEAGLDALMTTLEMDCGLSSDNVPVLYHDRVFRAELPGETGGKSRRKLGGELPKRIRDVSLAEIQDAFDPILNDGVIRGAPQTNDVSLSPVTLAFWKAQGRRDARGDAYLMPSLEQVLEFADFYSDYYASGPGKSHPQAKKRAKNAARVRFNIETKTDPREPETTQPPGAFVEAIGSRIMSRGLQDRADLQSFDLRTLLQAQVDYPLIRKVVLLGDFGLCVNPDSADADAGRTYCDDGTNLQPLDITRPVSEALADSNNTPWLAGLYWPYRRTTLDFKVRAQSSGGFEGMAISPDGSKLYPLLEKPLDGVGNTIIASELDIATKQFTGKRFSYQFEPKGVAIGEMVLFDANRGLIIERDNTQGDLTGLKRVYQVKLPKGGGAMEKTLVLDLNDIPDPNGLSEGTGRAGDIGLGNPFAFPFQTIESVLPLSSDTLVIVNDNNYPFSVGRHVGAKLSDDNEFIFVKLPKNLY
jgi:glycerophosphoryl diester phosphodiesterase